MNKLLYKKWFNYKMRWQSKLNKKVTLNPEVNSHLTILLNVKFNFMKKSS